MKVQCCVCKKVRVGTKWVSQSDPVDVPDLVSHGYCPVCAEHAFAEIRACFGPTAVASPAA